MATISQVRGGLKDRLATISGLRVSSLIVPAPSPPHAMVGSPTVRFDETFGSQATLMFPVVLVVSRATDDRGQQALDMFLEPTGVSSVAAAILGDPTLGGLVDSVRVLQGTPGVGSWGDVDFYQAEFEVEVFG